MTLEEKQELIKSATSEEELNQRMAEIEADKEAIKNDEKLEVAEEVKDDSGEITPEEERSLLKETKSLEKRSVEFLNYIERKDDSKMEKELRNSKEYIDAYAEYVKTGEEKELRALLTTGATGGTIEVPDFVDDVIRTAWQREGLMSLVRRISVKGNFKVQFEVSSTEAQVHAEGGEAVTEEELVLGVVTLKPQSIKKWISISDEALDMKGEAFLRYIYDELTYRIAKKTADILIAKISALPQNLTANSEGIYDTVSADKIALAPAVDTVPKAVAHLSDEANDLTIVMNRLTDADFIEAQLKANYPMDIYQNIRRVYNNTLPAYSNATEGQVYMIVGDFDIGAMANYPEEDGVAIKFDDKTLMTQDLVRVLGRRYVGTEAVADKAFALVTKPASV